METDDITFGKIYNNLIPIEYTEPIDGKYVKWSGKWVKCKCTCGTVFDAPVKAITTGVVKSCGCLKKKNGIKSIIGIQKKGYIITYKGFSKNIKQWSIESGIPYRKLLTLYKQGKTAEEIFGKE